MFEKLYRLSLISFALSLIFSGVFLYLIYFSQNKGDMRTTYFPQVEAKINFFQDSLGTQNYTESGSSFWSSKEYYNNSFDTARVSYGNQPTEAPVGITSVTTYISTSSH